MKADAQTEKEVMAVIEAMFDAYLLLNRPVSSGSQTIPEWATVP